MSKSREQLQHLLSQIDITDQHVIDIGCQDRLARNYTKGEPATYHTLDIDEKWEPDYKADLNHDWEQEQFLAGFKTLEWKPPQHDVVFCLEVLEHTWNPVQAVQNLAHATKPGGTVYISTPFINPHHDVWDYLRFTGEWYEKVLPQCGFDLVEIHERRATRGLANLVAFYQAEGMKYSKIRMQRDGAYTYPVGYFIKAEKRQ